MEPNGRPFNETNGPEKNGENLGPVSFKIPRSRKKFGGLTALPGKNRSQSVQVRSTNLNLTEVSPFLYRHFLQLSRWGFV